MSLQDITEQVVQLSVSDRLVLVNLIIQSLQGELSDQNNRGSLAQNALPSERTALLDQMRGLLKTPQPAPTDAAVQALLAERRAEKYLQ